MGIQKLTSKAKAKVAVAREFAFGNVRGDGIDELRHGGDGCCRREGGDVGEREEDGHIRGIQ